MSAVPPSAPPLPLPPRHRPAPGPEGARGDIAARLDASQSTVSALACLAQPALYAFSFASFFDSPPRWLFTPPTPSTLPGVTPHVGPGERRGGHWISSEQLALVILMLHTTEDQNPSRLDSTPGSW